PSGGTRRGAFDGIGSTGKSVAARMARRKPGHIGDSIAASGYGQNIGYGQLVRRSRNWSRPTLAVIRRVGKPPDVIGCSVLVRALRVPGCVKISALVAGYGSVNPPLVYRCFAGLGGNVLRR